MQDKEKVNEAKKMYKQIDRFDRKQSYKEMQEKKCIKN